jgi:DNA polymerase
VSVDLSSWAAVAAGVRACVACDLAAGRTQAVPGDLPAGPVAVMLVGEGPGADEDAVGRPFVGRSGRLLDGLLAEAGLRREDVAVANVVKCRPPGNRAPRAGEVAACRHWLATQIAAADPTVLVALGGSAVGWFLGRGARLTSLRGEPVAWEGRALVVTYHPSAALRFGPNGAPMAGLRADLRLVASLAGDAPVGERR